MHGTSERDIYVITLRQKTQRAETAKNYNLFDIQKLYHTLFIIANYLCDSNK